MITQKLKEKFLIKEKFDLQQPRYLGYYNCMSLYHYLKRDITGCSAHFTRLVLIPPNNPLPASPDKTMTINEKVPL